MMLFDIVRDLNDKIVNAINRGLPGDRIAYFTGTTDGYNVLIQFMGQTVWDSTDWEYLYGDEDSPTEAMLEAEMKRIRSHIVDESNKIVTPFFSIRLD